MLYNFLMIEWSLTRQSAFPIRKHIGEHLLNEVVVAAQLHIVICAIGCLLCEAKAVSALVTILISSCCVEPSIQLRVGPGLKDLQGKGASATALC